MTFVHSARARVVALAATSLLGTGFATSTGAAAAPHAHAQPAAKQALNYASLFANSAKLSSSSHKTFAVTVSALSFTSSGPDATRVQPNLSTVITSADVELALPNGSESHRWGFKVSPGQFKTDPKAGTGSIKTGSTFGSYGQLKLAIHPAGKLKQNKCSTQTSTVRPVNVTGTVAFDTKTGKHGWGAVKTKHFHSKGTLQGTYGSASTDCGSPIPKFRCNTGLYASVTSFGSSPAGGSISVSASKIGKRSSVQVTRSGALSKPSNASRTDSLTTAVKPLALKKGKGGKTVTLAGANSHVKGTAVWTANQPPSTTTPYCKNKVKATSYQAVFKNGKKPIRFTTAIEPPIKINTSTSSGGLPSNFYTYS